MLKVSHNKFPPTAHKIVFISLSPVLASTWSFHAREMPFVALQIPPSECKAGVWLTGTDMVGLQDNERRMTD